MIVNIYKTRGLISRSLRTATLVAEVEVEPSELPYDLTKFARRYGGDFAEIVYPTALHEELQPA